MAYYDLTQEGKDVQGFLDGAPTLSSAPTSSTTTYTKSGQSIAFVVGQFVRVAVTGGYDMYQLKDVTSGVATWVKIETYSVMGASGPNHASGLTPDTPSTAGTTKFLREDGTWQVPSYPNVGLPVSSGTATSLANLPVTNRLVVATISSNQSSVSISNGVTALTAGCDLHVIVKATSAVTITLPTSSPYINCGSDSSLSVASGEYAEINFVSDGTNIYVRAIS